MEENREEEKTPQTPESSGGLSSSQTPGGRRFEEVRKRVKEEVEREKVEGKREKKVRSTIIPPLRTYKDDIAKTIRKRQESFVSVLAAESKRRAKRAQVSAREEKTRISQFILVASAILFVAGISSFGLFFLLREGREGPALLAIPSHIFTEEQREIDITGKNRTGVMRALINEGKETNLTLGSLAQLYPTEVFIGEKRLVPPDVFLSRLEVRAPDVFFRILDDTMTLGVHIVSGNQSFLILSVNSFETAFASMLEWEDDIHEDLAPLFGSPSRIEPEGSIVFSVSTPFVDKVIKNRDARILRDNDGDIAFLYSFLDKETLVITTNELTFNEIVTRFITSQF